MPGTWDGASGATSGLPSLMLPMSAPFRCLRSCRFPLGPGARFELFEETLDLQPDLLAAAEAAPAGADNRHEAIAVLDRDQPLAPVATRAVDEQCLHIRLHARKHRVRILELAPRPDLQTRFRRAHRTGIEGHDALSRRVVEEERHVDRQPQALPAEIVEIEVFEAQPPGGHEPVASRGRVRTVEQDRARTARAEQLARLEVQQMAVLGVDRLAAQLAALELLG